MKMLFWNVDTQRDFMDSKGKLYIKDSETIKPTLKRLTELAQKYNIQVVNTIDFHTKDSKEISDNPDFKTSFPKHCLEGTEGVILIKETHPGYDEPVVIVNNRDVEINIDDIKSCRNIFIRKDEFDVFRGNRFTNKILEEIKPSVVIVYGVATNVCVNYAVLGLVEKNINVIVIKDAIKELPDSSVEDIYKKWKELGVELLTCSELRVFLMLK